MYSLYRWQNWILIKFHYLKIERLITQKDIQNNQLARQFIENIFKDILYANPNLDFYKGFFINTKEGKLIQSNKDSLKIYPGFSVNFIEIDKGNYLNVYFKTIIIPNETILEYLNIMSCKEKLKKEEIKEKIIGRGFKVLYTKKIYIIDDIDFDRNPKNQTFTYEGQTLNLIQYYEKKYKIKIKDEFQPLIIVRKKT